MTFIVHSSWGEHKILNYDINKHKFIEYFQELYNTTDLTRLHLLNDNYTKEGLCDIETELHKIFYNDIKTKDTFKQLYCNLIKDIHSELFVNEEYLIYQSFPSIRFQFINNICVPPHYDSDDIGRHPIGEKNFLLPITDMHNSRRLIIESSPGKGDYNGIDLDYGQLFYFNGNKCTHYNEINIEDIIRISLDFRVITVSNYNKYINEGNITMTNPRDPTKMRTPTKMIIGGYYQVTHIDDDINIMMNWHYQKELLLQTRPNFGEEEAIACYEYMKGGNNFVTEFKKTEELEKRLSEYIGTKHCIMTNNGNIALILALMALNIEYGDEVIVPNYTMIASINAIKMVGAIPIICDVNSESFTMSLDIIKQHITDKTKAVMHVSLNNRHCNIDEIKEFCDSNRIYLVEDAAQSLGCFVEGKHFGTFGDIGCFSLSTPKIISTGQGGFLVTNNDELASKIRIIKNFGRKNGGVDIFETFGINFKYTDIQAVIGIEQFKKLSERIKRMREIFDLYYSNLKDCCRMLTPQSDCWIPWFIDIFVEKREELSNYLKIHNIQTRDTYPEISKTPMYNNNNKYLVSEYVSTHGLFLPSHTCLTNREIKHICTLIKIYKSN
jgi:perosamine synthetase